MSRSRHGKIDPGNAISIEDALSIMIVMFVLFVLFLIPLVNIDRTKLEQAQHDTYWAQLAQSIAAAPSDSRETQPYASAFGLGENTIRISDSGARRYIEAVSPSGDLSVIMHEGNGYVSLLVKEHSAVVTYRYGDIHWSAAEKEWFTTSDTIDYGEKEFTIQMQAEYRQWTRQHHGF